MHKYQGSRDGVVSVVRVVVRALVSNQCGPGIFLDMCVEFDVGSCLTPRDLLWVLQFSSLLKNQHFQFPLQPSLRAPA